MSADVQPSVSAIAVIDLARELLQRGIIDVAALARLYVELPAQVELLRQQGDISDLLERRYPEAWLIWLWQQADQSGLHPELGITFGARISPEARGLPSHLLQECRDLGEVLTTYLDNILLVNPADHWQRSSEGDNTVLTFRFESAFDYPRCAVERSVAALYHWGCYLCAQPLPLVRVEFAFPPPDYSAAVEHCFSAPVHYQRERHALVVPTAIFATPVGGGQPYLRTVLAQRAQVLRERVEWQQSLSGRVRQLLDQDLVNYRNQGRLAEALYMSRSTLVRKLAREGVRFSQLLDQARQRCYQRLKHLPAAQLAEQLGFTDVSAYYKARRKWE